MITPFTEGTPLYKLLMSATVKDEWTARLAMMEEYDQTYGIFDHERYGEIDPMAIIGMHPAENPITGNKLILLTKEILACRLPEITNTPLLELLNYPRYYLDELLKDARKARQKEDDALKKLEGTLPKNKPASVVDGQQTQE